MGFWKALLFGKRLEREMDDELRSHIELQYRDNLAAGMTESAARKAAEERFGQVEKIQEECRDWTGANLVESIWQDLRFGARTFARNPAFSVVAVATLGLGIGANTAIFSVVHAVLLQPLPFAAPDRLVMVWENDRIRGTEREYGSGPDFLDLRRETRELEAMATVRRLDVTLTGEGDPERVQISSVTPNYFELLGVRPQIGRAFLPEEGEPGRDGTAVLSFPFWRAKFGGEREVVGKSIRLDGRVYEVIGVMPPLEDGGPNASVLWIPEAFAPGLMHRGRHTFAMLGRLGAGSTVEKAQAEMSALMARLEAEYPGDNKGRGAFVEPYRDVVVGNVRPALLILLGAVGCVLLIACANVAHLVLARSLNREKEIAVRRSLGASRARVARQFVTEALLLVGCGGLAGLMLAGYGVRVLVSLAPEDLPRLESVGLDWPVLVFAVGLCTATGVFFGLLPLGRVSQLELGKSLGYRSSSNTVFGERSRVGGSLIMVEAALAVVLLVGAGLLVRSFRNITAVDPGYDPRNLLSFQMTLPDDAYPYPRGWPIHDWPKVQQFADQLVEGIESLPGVEAAEVETSTWTTRVRVVGGPPVPNEELDEAYFYPVTAGYFESLRIPVREGRGFESLDDVRHPPVAVVNETFADRHFPDRSPVGERIVVYGREREIVGVAGNVRFRGLHQESPQTMYLPFAQNPLSSLRVQVRTSTEPQSVVRSVLAEVRKLDAGVAPFAVMTADESLAASLAQRRFTLLLLGLFAGLALALAIIGIYGVISYAVTQRLREFGIRLALGARPGDLLRMVVGRAMAFTAVGLGAGLVFALAFSDWMESLVFGVPTVDPVAFAVGALSLALAALAASYVPARRAAKTQPMDSLRCE